jgi:preprotein translocase subunit Sec61beta
LILAGIVFTDWLRGSGNSGATMATQADVLKTTDEALTVEERASAAAHAKFAEWRRAELKQRPRRILYFAIAFGVIMIVAVAFLVHGQS